MTLKRRPLTRRSRTRSSGANLDAVVIRVAGEGDSRALERLAALDSRELPAGALVVAEVEGRLVAAAPLGRDIEPISDPFVRTRHVRELLRMRAVQTA